MRLVPKGQKTECVQSFDDFYVFEQYVTSLYAYIIIIPPQIQSFVSFEFLCFRIGSL